MAQRIPGIEYVEANHWDRLSHGATIIGEIAALDSIDVLVAESRFVPTRLQVVVDYLPSPNLPSGCRSAAWGLDSFPAIRWGTFVVHSRHGVLDNDGLHATFDAAAAMANLRDDDEPGAA